MLKVWAQTEYFNSLNDLTLTSGENTVNLSYTSVSENILQASHATSHAGDF